MVLDPASLTQAIDLVTQADGLLVTAGAGMGVDSGLPDFRGAEGFWQAYPALYRATRPHHGFRLLQQIGAALPSGMAVFTSNVDGQFQQAGFDPARIAECHGSIHTLQCLAGCSEELWPADSLQPLIDSDACLLTSPLPLCPHCGALARPNILMFGDGGWVSQHSDEQLSRLEAWCRDVGPRLLVIELGAGTAIPSARRYGEYRGAALIRINPRESAVHHPHQVGIPLGAAEAMDLLHQGLVDAGFLAP